jgi:hypothetical protein
MPYTSSAGSSGVAHLACEYGVPIVASDIQDFIELSHEEGIAIEFYKSGTVEGLTERLVSLLRSPERLELMAMQNFSAALRMSMPEIIRQYIRSFDLQHRVKMLRAASRFRRVPRWMPLRPALRRHVGNKLATWHHSDFAKYLDINATEALSNDGLAADAMGQHLASAASESTSDDTLPDAGLNHSSNGNGSNGLGNHAQPTAEQSTPAILHSANPRQHPSDPGAD